MKKLNELREWKALQAHHQHIAAFQMKDWFKNDQNRFQTFSLTVQNLFLDYSKNRILPETMQLLTNFAQARGLPEKIEQLFSGYPVNNTEERPALHTALRNVKQSSLIIKNHNIMEDIRETLTKLTEFTNKVRDGTWKGYTGKPIKTILNIGIGGSHLGPLMTVHALRDFARKDLDCHFISNIDSTHLNTVLANIDPETTLFIISSKSFTTLETITNATTIIDWFKNKLNTNDLRSNFVAITAARHLAINLGIPAGNIFTLWDWVGGRFSIWSAIGLPLAIMIGMDRFTEFLEGAFEMDVHFRSADLPNNMPVILGLLGIWYVNFFHAKHHAVIPYAESLNYLRMYLQQLDMESNGKNISQEGHDIDISTCPVMFGEQGCNGQHAFHQLLHQGPHFIPVDFILVATSKNNFDGHQNILLSSALSQSQALMCGKSYSEAYDELKNAGYSEKECDLLARHKTTPGNRPSNTLVLNRMDPKTLGALIALYEHKTFVQGVIWQVNSFDQWGVELGKQLLSNILNAFKTSSTTNLSHFNDSSTLGLIEYCKSLRGNV